MDVNIVVRNLKYFLKDKKKTQETIARETGFALITVSRYARGKRFPDGDFIQQLVLSYNLNANWLLTGKGDMYLKSDSPWMDPDAFKPYPDEKRKDIIEHPCLAEINFIAKKLTAQQREKWIKVACAMFDIEPCELDCDEGNNKYEELTE